MGGSSCLPTWCKVGTGVYTVGLGWDCIYILILILLLDLILILILILSPDSDSDSHFDSSSDNVSYSIMG